MVLDGSTIWILVVPPIAGGIIGYFTNDLAITMLFRPYRAIKIGNYALPFTPGLIPRNQERLAQRISDAIMTSLLTPKALEEIAQRVLQVERVKGIILWLLQLALDQMKSTTEQKSAQILAHILDDFSGKSLPRIMAVLAQRKDFLQMQLDQIFDQVLLELQLTEAQAQDFANWVLEVALPPNALRLGLIDVLTDRNISILDQDLRQKNDRSLLGGRQSRGCPKHLSPLSHLLY